MEKEERKKNENKLALYMMGRIKRMLSHILVNHIEV